MSDEKETVQEWLKREFEYSEWSIQHLWKPGETQLHWQRGYSSALKHLKHDINNGFVTLEEMDERT